MSKEHWDAGMVVRVASWWRAQSLAGRVIADDCILRMLLAGTDKRPQGRLQHWSLYVEQ